LVCGRCRGTGFIWQALAEVVPMFRSDASVTTLPQPRWRRILLRQPAGIGFIWLALAEVVPMFLSEKLLGRARCAVICG
jgi:hypothetical protein